jgi:parallel beta-helix repeat protein
MNRTILRAALGIAYAMTGAAQGVVLIDQSKALAGAVTPGDAAGFPVTITQPGSYQLASNLTGIPAGIDAILVQADDVTIDLNGFAIIGPFRNLGAGIKGAVAGNGIRIGATVFNGTVRGMGMGIQLGRNSRVEKMHVSQNQLAGIQTDGFSLIQDNITESNGWAGIFAAQTSTVRGNTASGNGGGGIAVYCPSSVTGNTAFGNSPPDTDLALVKTGPASCADVGNATGK